MRPGGQVGLVFADDAEPPLASAVLTLDLDRAAELDLALGRRRLRRLGRGPARRPIAQIAGRPNVGVRSVLMSPAPRGACAAPQASFASASACSIAAIPLAVTRFGCGEIGRSGRSAARDSRSSSRVKATDIGMNLRGRKNGLAAAHILQEFLPGARVVPHDAQQGACGQRRAGGVDATHGHAAVLGLDHHADAARLQHLARIASAISAVSFSWICSRRAKPCTTRASLEMPTTRLSGR